MRWVLSKIHCLTYEINYYHNISVAYGLRAVRVERPPWGPCLAPRRAALRGKPKRAPPHHLCLVGSLTHSSRAAVFYICCRQREARHFPIKLLVDPRWKLIFICIYLGESRVRESLSLSSLHCFFHSVVLGVSSIGPVFLKSGINFF